MHPALLADELAAAGRARVAAVTPPSTREGGFDLDAAYAVEGELVRRRVAAGHVTVGLKVGYANKAVWRALKLDTLVWAHMYDDTVTLAPDGHARLPVTRWIAPKIEPEIVFKLKTPLPAGLTEPEAVLAHVEWLALGFEIIDCVYPEWKFQPSDFVAASGLHVSLLVGAPRFVTADSRSAVAAALAVFTVVLRRADTVAAEGAGKNALRSPALCLAELASARARRGLPPLAAGDLVSSGTLTESQPIHPGERWSAEAHGLDLAPLSVDVER